MLGWFACVWDGSVALLRSDFGLILKRNDSAVLNKAWGKEADGMDFSDKRIAPRNAFLGLPLATSSSTLGSTCLASRFVQGGILSKKLPVSSCDSFHPQPALG